MPSIPSGWHARRPRNRCPVPRMPRPQSAAYPARLGHREEPWRSPPPQAVLRASCPEAAFSNAGVVQSDFQAGSACSIAARNSPHRRPRNIEIGSGALRLTTPQERGCLCNLLDRIDAVERAPKTFDRDQNAGSDRGRPRGGSFSLDTRSGLSRRNYLNRIGLLLALLLQEAVNEVAARLQRRLERAKRWSFITEFLVTTFLQVGKTIQACVSKSFSACA